LNDFIYTKPAGSKLSDEIKGWFLQWVWNTKEGNCHGHFKVTLMWSIQKTCKNHRVHKQGVCYNVCPTQQTIISGILAADALISLWDGGIMKR